MWIVELHHIVLHISSLIYWFYLFNVLILWEKLILWPPYKSSGKVRKLSKSKLYCLRTLNICTKFHARPYTDHLNVSVLKLDNFLQRGTVRGLHLLWLAEGVVHWQQPVTVDWITVSMKHNFMWEYITEHNRDKCEGVFGGSLMKDSCHLEMKTLLLIVDLDELKLCSTLHWRC